MNDEAAVAHAMSRASSAPALVRSVLAVPLWLKLCGTNAIIIMMAAIIGVRVAVHPNSSFQLLELWLFGAMALSLVLNIVLVIVALRPLRVLERTAAEVWRGNISARVPESLLADRDMARVGHTLNLLVDALLDDRSRSRELASLVISQAEAEQARIAYELHESAAQRLAAEVMQISAIARDTRDALTRERLEEVRNMAAETLEYLRVLARGITSRTPHDPTREPGHERDRARRLSVG